jgi:hypothetical protein
MILSPKVRQNFPVKKSEVDNDNAFSSLASFYLKPIFLTSKFEHDSHSQNIRSLIRTS